MHNTAHSLCPRAAQLCGSSRTTCDTAFERCANATGDSSASLHVMSVKLGGCQTFEAAQAKVGRAAARGVSSGSMWTNGRPSSSATALRQRGGCASRLDRALSHARAHINTHTLPISFSLSRTRHAGVPVRRQGPGGGEARADHLGLLPQAQQGEGGRRLEDRGQGGQRQEVRRAHDAARRCGSSSLLAPRRVEFVVEFIEFVVVVRIRRIRRSLSITSSSRSLALQPAPAPLSFARGVFRRLPRRRLSRRVRRSAGRARETEERERSRILPTYPPRRASAYISQPLLRRHH